MSEQEGMLNFKDRDSASTLEEGLREYYASRDDLVSGRGASESAREFFRCHDAAHVVFGCDTSLTNEGMVKLWSFFGTTGGLGLMRDYRSPESREIYRRIHPSEVISTGVQLLPLVAKVLMRCRRMKKRWPWSEFELHRGRKLIDLRYEYGIEVITIE